jgi:hypothetical protein
VDCVCKDDYRKMLEQLKRVQEICEGKRKYRVPASRLMFGTVECAGLLYFDMRMNIKYRCDGGQDKAQLNIDKAETLKCMAMGIGNGD